MRTLWKRSSLFAVFTLVTSSLVAIAGTVGAPSASAATAVVYSAIPGSLPGNVVSVGFEATSTSEFGDEVGLTQTGYLSQARVTMSSWACESGTWNGNNCATTPGHTFSHPITFNVYSVDNSGPRPAPDTLLLSKTQTFAIPYRPTADSGTNCDGHDQNHLGSGRWYSAADDHCYNGLATTITFDMTTATGAPVTLPSQVIWTVAYNTSHYGNPPIGEGASCYGTPAGCPYDSLNVGANGSANTGTDTDPDGAFFSSTWAGAYCDNGANGTGSLRYDTGEAPNCTAGNDWTGFTPMAELTLSYCTTDCYVDAVNGDDSNSGLAGSPLKTIQAGINAVQSGGTVHVAAGTYKENVVVAKAVDIVGQNASTIVEPATSSPNCGGNPNLGSLCAGSSNVFLVQNDNVTIEHLTVDGNNPSVTSGVSRGGSDIDARNGIITNHAAGTYNNLVVQNVTVRNVYLRAVYASSGGTFTFDHDTVSNVQGDGNSVSMFNFGGSGTMSNNTVSSSNDALSANWSEGTQFVNNTITGSGSGVHSDNNGGFGGPGTGDTISGNHVSSCTAGGYGVFSFVTYRAQTISGNTVSGCDVGIAVLASCGSAGLGGCASAPLVTVSSNTVTGTASGQALQATTSAAPFGDGPVKVSADHNLLNGASQGVEVDETGGQTATVTLLRNDLSGNSSHALNNTGAHSVTATCNWWGSAANGPAGQTAGPATTTPWLLTSNLNDGNNCWGGSGSFPKVSITAQSVPEGNGGDHIVSVPVTLNHGSSNVVTVAYNTGSGTAKTTTGDFTASTGTLTFNPGETAKSVDVHVNGDLTPENYEYFYAKIMNPSNATLALGGTANTVKVTLQNDDLPKLVTNASVYVDEGSSALISVKFNFPYNQAIDIDVSSADGTAKIPQDYDPVPAGTQLHFGVADKGPHTVSVLAHTDGVVEPQEKFTVKLHPVGAMPDKTVTVLIRANST